jgi:NAD+ kinase
LKAHAESIRRVGLVANPEKIRTAALVRKAARALRTLECTVVTDPDTARLCGNSLPAADSLDTVVRNVDLLLVFGGDGTMLRIARQVAGLPVPILGVNVGNLGFLTSIPPEKLTESLRRILAGKFSFDERALLEATVQRGPESSVQIALNDFVLSRGASSRLIEIEVSVNGEPLTRYRCDGFIASSPTGSTAYSLAAGGSIVSPDAEVLTLTPICPHTLSIRPIVVSLASTVCVQLLSSRLVATLAADGQQQTELSAGDTVTIRRSPRSVRLLRPNDASFFSTLRQKFGWSGGKV